MKNHSNAWSGKQEGEGLAKNKTPLRFRCVGVGEQAGGGVWFQKPSSS